MVALLELEDDRSRVRLAPELGGAIADMDAKLGDGLAPLLRRWSGPDAGWVEVALNILVPFSNRISGGGFTFDSGQGVAFHSISPNIEEIDQLPIHGDGLLKTWQIESHSISETVLRLSDGKIGNFRYDARVRYGLVNGTLSATLDITNTGETLPFGGGFHPWFPRFADTRLRFSTSSVWLEDEVHLPTEKISLADHPDWDVGRNGALPKGLINNAFTDWDGHAEFDQPSLGLTALISASAALDTAIVYSPDGDSDFFCFEPVSHAVDAHNQPDHPGLVVLTTGETLSLSMEVGWRRYQAE